MRHGVSDDDRGIGARAAGARRADATAAHTYVASEGERESGGALGLPERSRRAIDYCGVARVRPNQSTACQLSFHLSSIGPIANPGPAARSSSLRALTGHGLPNAFSP